jgi:hypothetical protein
MNEKLVLKELVALVAGIRDTQQQEQALVIEASKHLEVVKARGILDKHAVSLLESLLNLHKVRENLAARSFSSPVFLIVEEGLHRVDTMVDAGMQVQDAAQQAIIDISGGDDLPTLDEFEKAPGVEAVEQF